MIVGILGGTFDPVHYGHLRLAEEAKEAWPLDRVIFVPAQVNPLKRDRQSVAGEHRLAMLRAAIADRPEFEASDVELQRSGPSFTIDTLETLRRERPGDEFVLILGMDAFRLFPKWKRWQDILGIANVLVATRPGEEGVDPRSVLAIESPDPICYDEAKQHYRHKTGYLLKFLAITPLAISATDIRARLSQGRSIRYLSPAPVINYIYKHRLYED